MQRYTRLSIVLFVLCLVILVLPNTIRYVMNLSVARTEIQQEKKYIAHAAKRVQTPKEQLPCVPHWDLSTRGKMKLVFSDQIVAGRDRDIVKWVTQATKIWNDALGAPVIEVTNQTVSQAKNRDVGTWPVDADFQIMVGVKSYSNHEILATTTIGGNMLWISNHALTVWRSNEIQPEDYKSGGVVGPVSAKKIQSIHQAEAVHTIAHEMGHAFGLKHQGAANDLMSPMVGIHDQRKPSKIEIDSVLAIQQIAMHPEMLNAMSFETAFKTEYQRFSGNQAIPANYIVINDEITE
ncbi:matrixin family metalloprotease [Weissella diestrammenae]|uniref:Matrixin family metalloprotease n=1 Tax=Weissella diestrammenae TaxID=1162633 RepID=A0A7G9T463_9LACO|nr:matrixin family metalloprotease [Weissella diestrammenae]MCM0583412.1 matrixin family metalloprotease [Weissella diestrammenae]QNN74888.1 matrixin family metalloprotease [Weissella diestrammenae]